MDRDEERAVEWDCQKVLRQYNDHVAQREFKKAVALFTPDVEWQAMGLNLKGRAALLDALCGALSKGNGPACDNQYRGERSRREPRDILLVPHQLLQSRR